MQIKRSAYIVCLSIIILQFFLQKSTLAQTDSLNSIKKVNFSIYPVFGYQPETSFTFGVISFIVFENNAQENGDYYTKKKKEGRSPSLV